MVERGAPLVEGGEITLGLADYGSNAKKATCVDLFAGAGGFSLAAKQAGLKVSAAVEIDSHACRTYRRNFITSVAVKDAPTLIEGDIQAARVKEELVSIFQTQACDLVLGGPPCQGFSVHRIRSAGVDDPRNGLILRYFELVQTLSPKAFLMENVPGILWPRHKSWLESFFKYGQDSGYRVFEPVTIDARDFGVPQRRKRVFILGVRTDQMRKDIVWPPKATHARLPEEDQRILPWVSARSIFENPVLPDDLNNIHMKHTDTLVEVFKSTPPDGGSRHESSRVLKCHSDHNGHKDVYGRMRLDEPAPTMTTACINPSKGRFVHPIEHHGITARQAARFQTFPDSFVFEGGLIASGVQIGNAVPVLLAKILIKHLVSTLNLSVSGPES